MTTDPLKEHSSTYVVDQSNQEEVRRLEIQDKMLNIAMGGVLPELDDPTRLRQVLDVGCGTGGWLMETTRSYPTIERLVGVDVSQKMMEYARTQAKEQHLDERVQFQTMDALRTLEFPAGSFDLVNQRLGFSWLRTWDWAKILLEYQRVSKPGGTIRITEPHITAEYKSPALTQLYDIALEACYNAGRLFRPSKDGITSELARLMVEHGIQNVETRVHTVVYQAGTETGQYFYKDMLHFFRVTKPFFEKWAHVPDDYEQIREQALKDIQEPDFVARWTFLTAWGTRTDGELSPPQGLP